MKKKYNMPRHAAYYSKEIPNKAKTEDALSLKRPKSKWIDNLYEWVAAAVFSLICVIFAFIFFFRIVGVDGSSMEKTLYNNERLVISTFMYHPNRGDIIIINRYPQEPLVKRVIAVGGDRISILPDEGKVVLNGVILEEDYAQGKTEPNDFGTETKVVPNGYIVVMGDNREVSKDSRKNEIGYVNMNDVVGKVILRFSPINRIRIF